VVDTEVVATGDVMVVMDAEGNSPVLSSCVFKTVSGSEDPLPVYEGTPTQVLTVVHQ